MIQLIDTHTHLDADIFDPDREAVIARAQQAGVARLINIGAGKGLDSATRAIALAERYPFIWASAGVHPHDASMPADPSNLTRLEKLASHPRVVAIGETGLDFFRELAPRDQQQVWFEAQIELAKRVHKPIVIHSREAGQQCLATLIRLNAASVGGVFHCYSEDAHFAEQLREINFLVSIPGSVTFKKSESLRQTVKAIPIEQIMVETDAPYLAPEPHRGNRCESAFVAVTAQTIANIKGLTLEELANATSRNACKLFRLPEFNA